MSCSTEKKRLVRYLRFDNFNFALQKKKFGAKTATNSSYQVIKIRKIILLFLKLYTSINKLISSMSADTISVLFIFTIFCSPPSTMATI